MKKILPVTVLISCLFLPVLSQEQSAEELFYDGLFFYQDEQDYPEAAYIFRQLLEREPDNSNAKFLLGMCYNNIRGQEEMGIPYFREAVQDISLRYKTNRYSEKKAPHHAWFYLAEAYRKTNQMDAALDALNQFQSLRNFDRYYNVGITEAEIAAVERAKIIRDAELNLRALYFNEPINTTDNDYNGVISANGKMMVWVNSRAFYEAVYMSIREENNWSQPILITPQIVSDGDLFPTGLNADGTMLLLVKDPQRGDSDIWYSTYDGLLWSPARGWAPGKRGMPPKEFFMQKMKSNRGAAKRLRKTGSGKIRRMRAYKSHILTKKDRKRKRRLRSATLVAKADEKRARRLLAS